MNTERERELRVFSDRGLFFIGRNGRMGVTRLSGFFLLKNVAQNALEIWRRAEANRK
jgi:hypothetical protein